MKKSILIICFTLSMASVFSQKWEQTIGEPYLTETSNRGIEHYDKGYILTGTITAGYRDGHGWVVKTDINGNVLWDKVFGLDPDQVILDNTQFDEQGNMYLFGTMRQNTESGWSLLVKLNACGEKEWCKFFDFSEEYETGFFTDAIVLKNGDLLGLAYMPDEEQHDQIFLFCVSPNGELKWKKSYASCDNYPLFEDRLGRRIQQFDDIFIISGYVTSPHPNIPNISSLRPMYIGIDTLFNEKWVLEFGLVDNMKGTAHTSIPINDSLFMGVGRYRYSDSTGMTMDAWAMFYNDKGEQTGYKRITRDKLGYEVSESTFYEVERINDSLYISTAGFYSTVFDEATVGEIVFDTSGNVYNYEMRIGTPASTYLTKTFDNKYVIATSEYYSDYTWDMYLYKINQNLEQDTLYPGNYTYDSLCKGTIESGVIDLAGCDIVTSMEEIPTLEEYKEKLQSISIKAYPNPAKESELTFGFQNTEYHQDMKLQCFNVFGKMVHEEKIYQYQGASKIDIKNWKPGMYVALIFSNGKIAGQTKFVVQ